MANNAWQRPEYRDPAHLTPRDVCPHCKRETEIYPVFCDGHTIETHRCRDHGDVVPVYDSPGFAPPINAATTMAGNIWDGEGP